MSGAGGRAAALIVGAGLALGLALASKWVALYAIGGLVLLVLLRSALGRLIALAGLIATTAVLGALAIRPPEVADPSRNWTFLAVMVLLTMLLAAGIVRRPLPLSRTEALIGGALPILVGVALAIGSLARGRSAARWPRDPDAPPDRRRRRHRRRARRPRPRLVVTPPRQREPDAPRGRRRPSLWLTPARAMGVGWLFTLAALGALPLAVYVLSYAPWVELGNQWLEGFPAGHTGQTLAELTASMYEYHDDLRAEHAASSPWWAWPFDLKPVWFYQDSFAGPTTGLIHDTGNLVVFWLGVPAMAFAAWAAWRRRSISLGLVVVLWLALWLPWARIDRATFQYHVYASLPFLVIALAYLLAELWRGPGLRTWFIARVATALVVLGVPLLWLARQPLCRLAGTSTANPDGVACGAIDRTAQLSPAAIGALLVLAVGAIVIAWLAWRRTEGARGRYPASAASRAARGSVPLAILAVALGTLGWRHRRHPRARPPGERHDHGVARDPRARRPRRALAGRVARPACTGRPPLRARYRRGRGRLVHRLVPEHRGAPAARGHRARLSGRAADMELGLPVRGQPGPARARAVHRHDDVRARDRRVCLRRRRCGRRALVGPRSALPSRRRAPRVAGRGSFRDRLRGRPRTGRSAAYSGRSPPCHTVATDDASGSACSIGTTAGGLVHRPGITGARGGASGIGAR